MQIKYTEVFWNDIKRIGSYLDHDRSDGESSRARSFARAIIKELSRLTEYPKLGQAFYSLKNEDTGFRYLLYKNYIVFYFIEGKDVVVFRVFDQREDYIDTLFNIG